MQDPRGAVPRTARLLEAAVALLCRLGGLLGAITGLVCFALVCVSVGWRYFLGQPQPWIDHVAAWLVVGLVMFAAGETQRREEHIGVEVLTARLPRAGRRAARILGAASVALTAAILLVEGIATVSFSRMIGIATNVEGVPLWWVHTLIPLGAALLLAAALAQVVVLACGLEPRGPERKAHHGVPGGRAE
ncbi:TRAP transporter small permease [Elioraea sp. Yellowstone]|jgi:TRAP-type C4-dicarboxylate transport system permease small subunit|uniref:TRAP transporter small permease n=1 Tax=Elioraea sp. Yellowstone TaxID=2592070 RepID=UPI00115014D3|nr:TRAP transporter small permease [Elioraea sp. Yellowstone]TQF79524.1 TRAP transporter small permease [Elioraea sp. Yellowstone]